MMKFVITDYPDTLKRDLHYEVAMLQQAIPHCQVAIHPYVSHALLAAELRDADGVLTAFLPLDGPLLDQCPKLRCISVNAAGYDAIDLQAATSRGIAVCAIREYCTEEVADSAMALLLALAKKLKCHQYAVETEHIWQYKQVGPVLRLRGKILAIFGLGRIGREVALRAMAFGMRVVAVDPYLPPEMARQLGVELVNADYVCTHAHFISNHMLATEENEAVFDCAFFQALRQKPFFINVARASAVDERALLQALDEELVSGAALDVLSGAGLDLDSNPLIGRRDVIVTPHAAFYSTESLKALQEISCQNMIHYCTGAVDQLDFWVNRAQLTQPLQLVSPFPS